MKHEILFSSSVTGFRFDFLSCCFELQKNVTDSEKICQHSKMLQFYEHKIFINKKARTSMLGLYG